MHGGFPCVETPTWRRATTHPTYPFFDIMPYPCPVKGVAPLPSTVKHTAPSPDATSANLPPALQRLLPSPLLCPLTQLKTSLCPLTLLKMLLWPLCFAVILASPCALLSSPSPCGFYCGPCSPSIPYHDSRTAESSSPSQVLVCREPHLGEGDCHRYLGDSPTRPPEDNPAHIFYTLLCFCLCCCVPLLLPPCVCSATALICFFSVTVL